MRNSEVRYMFMDYYIKKDYFGYDCNADDFLSDINKVVLANESDKDFYGMMCFKNAVLIKAKKDIYDWSKRFISKHVGFRCFDFQQTATICKELLKYNYSMQGGQGLLPDMTIKRIPPETNYPIHTFSQNQVTSIYNYTDKNNWHMCHPTEETSLVVAAFDKDRIIGLSSADINTDNLWSIDVEVLPEYRQNGIAVALTSEITNIILSKDIIPFATGAWSNTASRTTLYKCGYYSAWSSMGSCDNEWAIKMLNDSNE